MLTDGQWNHAASQPYSVDGWARRLHGHAVARLRAHLSFHPYVDGWFWLGPSYQAILVLPYNHHVVLSFLGGLIYKNLDNDLVQTFDCRHEREGALQLCVPFLSCRYFIHVSSQPSGCSYLLSLCFLYDYSASTAHSLNSSFRPLSSNYGHGLLSWEYHVMALCLFFFHCRQSNERRRYHRWTSISFHNCLRWSCWLFACPSSDFRLSVVDVRTRSLHRAHWQRS